jgi:selenocysteine lyase/cysteine desulfurase
MVATVRDQILDFFNASAKDYSIVFTGGATAGLKLVQR